MRKRARDAGAKGKTRSSDSAAGETGGNECLEGRRHFELSLHHRQNQIAAAAAAAAVVVVVVVHVVVVVVETLEKITRRTDLAATFVRSPLPASSRSRVLDSARFRAQADTGAEAAEKRSVDCAERFLKRNFRNTPISVSRTPFDHSTHHRSIISIYSNVLLAIAHTLSRTRSKRIGLFPGARIAAARSCSEEGSSRATPSPLQPLHA